MSQDFIPDAEFKADTTSPERVEVPKASVTAGTHAPDFISDEHFESDEDKYGSGTEMLKTAAEGLLRGATLGVSDLAENALFDNAKERALRKEVNPATALGSNVLGGAAITAATGGLAAPLEGAAVASGMGQIAARALGFGAEGAVFGAGNAISDWSLGDPNLTAGKVLADVGIGAVFGAALGAGSGKIKTYLGGHVQDVADQANNLAKTSGALSGEGAGAAGGAIGGASGASEQGGAKLFKGLNQQKGNAAQILAAGKRSGIPVSPVQLSDSPWMQKASDALRDGAPTYAGIAEQEALNKVYKGSERLINEAFENVGEQQLSKADVGEMLQKTMANKITDESGPINQIYDALRTHTAQVEVPEKAAASIMKEIAGLQQVRVDAASPAGSLANRISRALRNVENVDDLKFLRTSINSSLQKTASGGERHMAGVLSDMLGDLEKSSILKAARNSKLPAEAQATMRGLLAQSEEAARTYAPFKQKLTTLLEQLGKKNVGGAQSAIAHIEDMKIEDIAEKLLKGKSEFNTFFQKNFPEEASLLRMYQKQSLLEKAQIAGKFSPQKLLTELRPDKTPKELLSHLFSGEELSKIEDARTLLHSLPKNFNPSGTSGMSAFRAFFESPTGAALANVRDFGIRAFMQAMDTLPALEKGNPYMVGAELAQKFNQMSAAAKIAERFDEKLSSGVSAIFHTAGDAARGGALSATSVVSNHGYDRAVSGVKNMTENPEAGLNHLVSQTSNLEQALPNVVAGIHKQAISAAGFLAQKMPKPVNQLPFSQKFEPSPMQKQRFMSYYHAVNDPLSVLKQVKQGTLTNESLEALTIVHPQLLQEMRKQAAQALEGKKGRGMNYGTKISLAKFLGHPLDTSMLPNVIRANQMALSGPQLGNQQAPKTSGRRGSMSKLDLAGPVATRTRVAETDRD